MSTFISHSRKDEHFALRLADALRDHGIEIWMDEFSLKVGDNILEKVHSGLHSSDSIIPVLSKNYVASKRAMQELSFVSAKAVTERSIRIIPVLLEDCDIPVFLRDRVYADFRHEFDQPLNLLLVSLLQERKLDDNEAPERSMRAERGKQESLAYHASKLKHHLEAGELTLICGAGVSVDAGVPSWRLLLNELLGNLIERQLPDAPSSTADQRKLVELYQTYISPTSLVVAQYLKNGLGDDFLSMVRQTLYAKSTDSSDLLDAIVDLCRPQRSRKSLQAIISFNFDDLIESNLKRQHITHVPIYSEGKKANRFELPVYHVNGFLPKEGELSDENTIVFSEDTYHSQFIDPFSWSNLVQLNQLNHSICLFVGLSITDPNLRRLLDVSMRKNPGRHANHYVFKLRHDAQSLNQHVAALGLEADDADTAKRFVAMSEILEEQDSNNLGLNTIWVDDFDEIPPFLKSLARDG